MRFDLAVPDLIEAYGEAEKRDARELERYQFTVISLEGEEVEGVVVFLGRRPSSRCTRPGRSLCAHRGDTAS